MTATDEPAAFLLETNIQFYSISRDPAEAAKRERALRLLDDDDGALSVQVLQEFNVQATRASRPDPIPHDLAVGPIGIWLRFAIQEITLPLLTAALKIEVVSGFSNWDSAIIAAARALGCRRLCSEDMSHGRQIDGVTIVNPFR
jgi:predicted nucleic acid-binding protein